MGGASFLLLALSAFRNSLYSKIVQTKNWLMRRQSSKWSIWQDPGLLQPNPQWVGNHHLLQQKYGNRGNAREHNAMTNHVDNYSPKLQLIIWWPVTADNLPTPSSAIMKIATFNNMVEKQERNRIICSNSSVLCEAGQDALPTIFIHGTTQAIANFT